MDVDQFSHSKFGLIDSECKGRVIICASSNRVILPAYLGVCSMTEHLSYIIIAGLNPSDFPSQFHDWFGVDNVLSLPAV